MWHLLYRECLHVFQNLSAADLSICARVSSHWHRLANDRQLWKKLFLSRFSAPKRPNLTYILETIQMIPNSPAQQSHHNNQMNLNDSDDNWDNEDWKTIYRVSHNWQTGNCRVVNFKPDVTKRLKGMGLERPEWKTFFPTSFSAEAVSQDHVSSNRTHLQLLNSNPLVQFTKHVILTAAYSSDCAVPEIHLWRAGKQNSHIATLKSDILTQIHQPSPIAITCMKLDSNLTEYQSSPGMQKIVAGYSNGGFSIWEIDTIARQHLTTSLQPQLWIHRELCTALPPSIYIDQKSLPPSITATINTPNSPLITCTLHTPILITCTRDFILSIYLISEKEKLTPENIKNNQSPSIKNNFDCHLLHQLKSYVCWAPVDITLEEYSSNDEDNNEIAWKATVAYAVPVYGGGWTVGVQEIKFNMNSILSTIHCSPLPPSGSIFDGPFLRNSCSHSPRSSISTSVRSFAPITTIKYNAAYLITAHSDNTLQVYHVLHTDDRDGLECKHVHTLYGHTGSVTTVAIDSDGKLVTGAMDESIKIWDLSGRVAIENTKRTSINENRETNGLTSSHFLHGGFQTIGMAAERKRNGECIVTLNNIDTDTDDYYNRINHGRKAGVKWLDFDEGRIVSVSGGGGLIGGRQMGNGSVSNASNELSPPPGWKATKTTFTMMEGVEVGVVKVWSFCDE
ncbi:hypothetical protein G9A89_003619 [Geosiphon pyriformis]|nr:hypothetical protein G9A89_003619 [Geosiphon pyriformis]